MRSCCRPHQALALQNAPRRFIYALARDATPRHSIAQRGVRSHNVSRIKRDVTASFNRQHRSLARLRNVRLTAPMLSASEKMRPSKPNLCRRMPSTMAGEKVAGRIPFELVSSAGTLMCAVITARTPR